jgi:hypothetical protein
MGWVAPAEWQNTRDHQANDAATGRSRPSLTRWWSIYEQCP